MNRVQQSTFALTELVPGCLTDVEGAVLTEMSCLGARLVTLYVPPVDIMGDNLPPEDESRILFWDFPHLSRLYFRSFRDMAAFVPIRWQLSEVAEGTWMRASVPDLSADKTRPVLVGALTKLAADVETAFARVCGRVTTTDAAVRGQQNGAH
ncbi:hypothetical protein MQE22_08690 [Acidithiobacillus sp. YTS05]|nr:hypothetical protein MQE22_08690 [Acidithiobacillus sp. YTS05]